MRLFFDKIMGKAFSCCCHLRNNEEGQGVNETTGLLAHTKVRDSDSNCWQTNSGPTIGSTADLLNNSLDSQNNNSQSNEVEKELAKKLIDITAMDRPIDKCEWQERLRLYEKRVAQIKKPLILTSNAISDNLPEEPVSKRRFNPIDVEDLELITSLSERASHAVLSGFKIEQEDSVIALFKPWTRS